MPLRDYQSAAHDAILRGWGIQPFAGMDLRQHHKALAESLGHTPWLESRDTHQSLIAALATAAGKTTIAAAIIQTLSTLASRPSSILFCADTDELCQQPIDKISTVTGNPVTLEKAEALADPRHRVCVASVQSLTATRAEGRETSHSQPSTLDSSRLSSFCRRWGVPDFIIHDEAHTAPDRAAAINRQFPKARILGLTATPFREGNTDLSQWYEATAFRMDYADLVEQGWITPVVVQPLRLHIAECGMRNAESLENGGPRPRNITYPQSPIHNPQSIDFDPSEAASIISPVYHEAARFLKCHARNRSVLAFHPLIKSSRAFTAICREEGLSAAHCDGSSNRAGVLERFEQGEIQVLSNSGVFNKGVDFIRADTLLNLDITRSPGKFRQRAGRILRVLPGVIDPQCVSSAERRASRDWNGSPLVPRPSTPSQRRQAIADSKKPNALILDTLCHHAQFGLCGAASLIARDDVERRAIERRIRQNHSPQELAQIQAEVVRAREQGLLNELEKSADRLASMVADPAEITNRDLHDPHSTASKLDRLLKLLAHEEVD
jgi:superfamily II DNA or RNA helicase